MTKNNEDIRENKLYTLPVIGLNMESLKQLDIKKKFTRVFNKITIMVAFAVMALVFTVLLAALGLINMHDNYFKMLELGNSTAQITEMMERTYRIAIIFLVFSTTIACFLIAVTLLYIGEAREKLFRAIDDPVDEIGHASVAMADGDFKQTITYKSDDELGKISNAMEATMKTTRDIIDDMSETLGRIAGGDFSHGTERPELYKGDYAPIAENMDKLTARLSNTKAEEKTFSGSESLGGTSLSELW